MAHKGDSGTQANFPTSVLNKAKSYLQTSQDVQGNNLYDHLTEVLLRILEQKPANTWELFEQISARTKQTKLQDRPVIEEQEEQVVRGTEWAELVNKLLEIVAEEDAKKAKEQKEKEKEKEKEKQKAAINKKPVKSGRESLTASEVGSRLGQREVEEEPVVKIPDIQLQALYFENAGISVASRQDIFRLVISIKLLASMDSDIKSVRLWGKIFGTQRDYFVLETEYKQDDLANASPVNRGASESGKDSPFPPVPAPGVPQEVPAEKNTGANQYVYWVCNSAGGVWSRLPDVTPSQIVASRTITKFFTGHLDTPINTYPPFPGTEANYLRAQIARISHSTIISPKGYYYMKASKEDPENPDAAEPEETASVVSGPPQMVENPEYRRESDRPLLRPDGWVHQLNYLLPQGRCTFWRPPKPVRLEENPDESGAEDNKPEDDTDEDVRSNTEDAPDVLTPLGLDSDIRATSDAKQGTASFICRKTSQLSTHSSVFVRSSRWPGAYAVAFPDNFANVYLGWGQKYTANCFTPALPPRMQMEGHTRREQLDPTVEMEKELEERKNPKPLESETLDDDTSRKDDDGASSNVGADDTVSDPGSQDEGEEDD